MTKFVKNLLLDTAIESLSASPTDNPRERQVQLRWQRNRLFDELATVTLFSLMADEKTAIVSKYEIVWHGFNQSIQLSSLYHIHYKLY